MLVIGFLLELKLKIKIDLSEETIRIISTVLANCITHIRYEEDGDLTTLTQGFQNLVKAKNDFDKAIAKQKGFGSNGV